MKSERFMPQAILFDLDETLTDRGRSVVRYAERFRRDFAGHLGSTPVATIAAPVAAADVRGYRPRGATPTAIPSALQGCRTEGKLVRTKHNKLVRDRIPQIIRERGEHCEVRVLDDAEYVRRLDEKLVEELQEYRQSSRMEELVDLVEVVRAIVAIRGGRWDEFEHLRERKRKERGGFERRLLLVAAEDD